MESEVIRSSLCPQIHISNIRNGVIGRVHLNGVKMACIVFKPSCGKLWVGVCREIMSSLTSCSGLDTTALFTMGYWTNQISFHFYTPFLRVTMLMSSLTSCSGPSTTTLFAVGHRPYHVSLHFYAPFLRVTVLIYITILKSIFQKN